MLLLRRLVDHEQISKARVLSMATTSALAVICAAFSAAAVAIIITSN